MNRQRAASATTGSISSGDFVRGGSPVAVHPQQFERVIDATTKTSKTSVFESKILLKQQGNVESTTRMKRDATVKHHRVKASQVLQQVDRDFEFQLNALDQKQKNWDRRQAELKQAKMVAQRKRLEKKTQRITNNKIHRDEVLVNKVKRTLDLQQEYEKQNARSLQRQREDEISRTAKSLELFEEERRELSGESQAFWYNNCKAWKEKTVRHPAVDKKLAAKAAEPPPLSARSTVSKATVAHNAEQRMIQRKSITALSPPPGGGRGAPARSPHNDHHSSSATIADLHQGYQNHWNEPRFGISKVPMKQLDHCRMSFEERQEKQRRKEEREGSYLEGERKMHNDNDNAKWAHSHARREELNGRRAMTSIWRQQKSEDDVALYSNRRSFAQKIKEDRQHALDVATKAKEKDRAQHYNRNLSLIQEKLEHQSQQQTRKMQQLASRLAKRTVLME